MGVTSVTKKARDEINGHSRNCYALTLFPMQL